MNNYGAGSINQILGAFTHPMITSSNICTFQYYRDMLASKIISLFKFKMPDTWTEFVPWWVILGGWCAVVRTPEFGVIPIIGTLSGVGVWNQPTEILVAQPLVQFKKPLKIGTDAEAIRLTPFYTGVAGIVNHYATLLTLADNAIYANLVNSRIGHVFAAGNQAVAKSIKTIFEQINNGMPAVVDAKVAEHVESEAFKMLGEPGKHVITDKLLENKRAIYRDFCRDVGIRAGNEDKRERLTTAEVEISDDESERLLSYWLRHVRSSMENVNKLFGLELGVEVDGRDVGRTVINEGVASLGV